MSETEAIIKANSENEKKIFDGKQKARSEKQSAEAAAQAAQDEKERKDRAEKRDYERQQAEAAKKQVETLAASTPTMSLAAAELGKSMTDFASDTVTAGKILTADNVATTSVSNLTENFKAGKLNVSHNLPNTNISLNISLSSEKIASEMYKVDLGTGDNSKFMQGGSSQTTGVRPV